MRINGKKVVAVKRNGREFIRVARGGVDLWTSNALPSGFTALEYVQSSGSQYVDTGIAVSPEIGGKIKYVIDSQMMDTSQASINGTGWGASPYFNSFYVGFYQNQMCYGNGRTDVYVSDTVADSNRHIFTYDAKNGIASISGIKEESFSYQTPDDSLQLLLFGYSQSSSKVLHPAKIYSCKIYVDDVLVRDFAPCMNASNVCGLYDRVNKVFYPSASSTALLPPDDVTV